MSPSVNWSLAPYKWAISCLLPWSKIVDLGCGSQPYRRRIDFMSHFTSSVVGVDKNHPCEFEWDAVDYVRFVSRNHSWPDYFVCFHSLYQFPSLWPSLRFAKKGVIVVETNRANPIGYLWRKLWVKPNREGLLNPKDLGLGELKYFTFLAILPLGRWWYSLVEPIDEFLITKCGVTWLAWKWVFVWRNY